MRYFLALPVWGERYTEIFLRWALPSLLAPGNLSQGPFDANAVIFFYTTAESRQKIEADPLFALLSQRFQLQWNIFEIPAHQPHRFYKHTLLSGCYADALDLARIHGAGFIPLTADNLYSEGSFAKLLARAPQHDLILLAGPRLHFQATEALEVFRKEGLIHLSSGALVRLALQYPHPHFSASFKDAENFTSWPSHVYEWQDANSFVAHCFHLHPILIAQPRTFTAAPEGSNPHLNNLDSHYLQQYFEAGARFGIVDSSEICGMTLSLPEDVPLAAKSLDEAQREQVIQNFSAHYCLAVHRFFFQHPITFCADPV